MKQNDKKYSPVQYFFWLISGSEISILKECPADYNRHAGIGFTIFMTSLFGAFAGGYAGYFFAKDARVEGFDSNALLPAVIFGIIWGLLVFSIDRSMVISLKKDPNSKKQKFWGPLLSRAVLGGLIAFIISIPLEIKIFEETIIANEKDYKESKVTELNEKKLANNNIVGLSEELAEKKRESAKADSLLNLSEPTTLEFRKKNEEWLSNRAVANRLSQEWSRLSADAKNALNKVPLKRKSDNPLSNDYNSWVINKNTSHYTGKYIPKLNAARAKEKQYKQQLAYTSRLEQEKNNIRDAWIKVVEDKRNYADSSAMALDREKSSRETNIKAETDDLSSILRDQMGFISRYEILSYAAYKPGNSTVLFFLWLIRILFFVIEVLPTIVKLSTSVGQYDWAVYNKEQDFINVYLPAKTAELEKDVELQKRHKKRNEEYKLKKEQELYHSTVDEVARIQNNIAQKILSEYEDKESGKIGNNIESFLQRSVN
jgi:hypothetical protein